MQSKGQYLERYQTLKFLSDVMSSKTATNERVQNQKGMTTIEKKAKFWQESRQKPYKDLEQMYIVHYLEQFI